MSTPQEQHLATDGAPESHPLTGMSKFVNEKMFTQHEGFTHHNMSRHEKCTVEASNRLWAASAAAAVGFAGAWWALGLKFPAIKNFNWRGKAITSSVGTIAVGYVQGELKLISCVQEYEERDKLRKQKLREKRREDAAAANAAAATQQ